MAKSNRSTEAVQVEATPADAPTLQDMMKMLAPRPAQAVAPEVEKPSLSSPATAVLVEIPIGAGDIEPRQFCGRLDMHLSPEQSAVLYAIKNRLDAQQARLKNDKRVYNIHGAIRWLLEAIAKEASNESSPNP